MTSLITLHKSNGAVPDMENRSATAGLMSTLGTSICRMAIMAFGASGISNSGALFAPEECETMPKADVPILKAHEELL